MIWSQRPPAVLSRVGSSPRATARTSVLTAWHGSAHSPDFSWRSFRVFGLRWDPGTGTIRLPRELTVLSRHLSLGQLGELQPRAWRCAHHPLQALRLSAGRGTSFPR